MKYIKDIEMTQFDVAELWIHERNGSIYVGGNKYTFTWTYVGKFLSRKGVVTVECEVTGFGHVMTKTGYVHSNELAAVIHADAVSAAAKGK